MSNSILFASLLLTSALSGIVQEQAVRLDQAFTTQNEQAVLHKEEMPILQEQAFTMHEQSVLQGKSVKEMPILQEQAFTKNEQSVLQGKSVKEMPILQEQSFTKNEQSVLQGNSLKDHVDEHDQSLYATDFDQAEQDTFGFSVGVGGYRPYWNSGYYYNRPYYYGGYNPYWNSGYRGEYELF